MQKRTIESLMNQTQSWHRLLARGNDHKNLAWPTCGIPGYDRVEGVPGNQK